MLQQFRKFVRRTFVLRLRSKYTRTLEAEVARLRAENHALVDSLFGVAGIPPVRAAAHSPVAGATLGSPGRGPSFVRVNKPRTYESALGNPENGAHNAPLRKRSWQQIGRLREIEDLRAARRERKTDTEMFPTPRSVVPRA